ncbi:MAG: thiamine pyrophosphate-dependent enzyme [Magnetospiraceae bacterium]
MDRAQIVHENYLRRVAAGDFPSGNSPTPGVTPEQAHAVFAAQVASRALDLESRAMQRAGQGFYTIGSSGHEGMAAVALALRPTDPAFLHYRDAAFQIARAGQAGHGQILQDMLLSFACAAADPISGGRHKVLGSKSLNIPPQTSTIASHLPKAVGAAFSVDLARRPPPEHRAYPEDALVMCSFGDASINHATAQGALNAAGWAAYQGTPLPLLFVCEDNGLGISVPTPPGWVAASMAQRPGWTYLAADGLDLFETFARTREAASLAREKRRPVFLHLRMVRLYGHAGADIPTAYLTQEAVEADEANDPLLHAARLLAEAGFLPAPESLALYQETLETVHQTARTVVQQPPLSTASDVMASLIPPRRACTPITPPTEDARADIFGTDLSALDAPQPMNRLINAALTDLMLTHPDIIVMGEDVGRKGGVYGVTQRLQARFGRRRVFDTLLDEQTILGLAIGLGQNGFVPIPEIQFLAYLHNAEDQLRGEAATLPFFSDGQFSNPMVVRIAGLGYQRGFGGHFHNDNSIAVLRDIPGLVIACPSDGADAARMLREAVRLAREEQRVVIFLEPIALYALRDLHAPKDGAWLRPYPAPQETLPLGEVGVHGDGMDTAIITYGNGRYLAHQAAKTLRDDHGIAVRILDLRWIAPLAVDAIRRAAAPCKTVLIVDECRRTGGQGEALRNLFLDRPPATVDLLAAEDSFIATGPAYAATLPSAAGIVAAVQRLQQISKE